MEYLLWVFFILSAGWAIYERYQRIRLISMGSAQIPEEKLAPEPFLKRGHYIRMDMFASEMVRSLENGNIWVFSEEDTDSVLDMFAAWYPPESLNALSGVPKSVSFYQKEGCVYFYLTAKYSIDLRKKKEKEGKHDTA